MQTLLLLSNTALADQKVVKLPGIDIRFKITIKSACNLPKYELLAILLNFHGELG